MATYDRQYKIVSAVLSPAEVAANTCAAEAFAVVGVEAGDAVVAIKPTEQAGLGIGGARVDATGSVTINFCNPTAAAITPTAAQTYLFIVVKP